MAIPPLLSLHLSGTRSLFTPWGVAWEEYNVVWGERRGLGIGDAGGPVGVVS